MAGRMPSPLAAQLQQKMILAPLTKGGNLPFRRLCGDFGMEASMSEMVYARHLLKGDRIEKARLRRAPNEQLFGVQIATNDLEEGIAASKLVAESGADWIDLNCGWCAVPHILQCCTREEVRVVVSFVVQFPRIRHSSILLLS